MQSQGLIVRVGHGYYDAGVAIAQALAGVSPLAQLASAARRPLARLAREVRAPVHLAALDGDMATYLVKIGRGRGVDALFTVEGGQLEAYCTAVGKMLLAGLPDEEQRRYCASGPFVRLTEHTIVDPAQLYEAIRNARVQGWACDDHEMADGLYCVAVPVRDHAQRIVAAISMSFAGVARDFRPGEEKVAKLKAVAEKIGTALK